MPALEAAFQPTVIVMSRMGASAVAGWLGASQSSSTWSVPGTRQLDFGMVDDDWTPPAMTARSMPAMIEPAAVDSVPRPEAQWRLWAMPGHVLEPGLDRGVAGDGAAAVDRFAEHHVVDQRRVDARPPDALGHGLLGQLERVHLGERPLERGADRGAAPWRR